MVNASKGFPIKVILILFLSAAIFLLYRQTLNYDFVDFDDPVRVTNNHHVRAGLTPDSLAWSFNFTEKNIVIWHPLTWISHMLDCQLFGLDSGMHHLTSVLLHIINCILLFLVFERMTGALWRSVFIAALFAFHPVNVDSVAWVAERKNVLSTFFWLLTMFSYAIYTERPGIFRYILIFLAFALGLLAKPMLVTLPFALLLLDYWPLNRFQNPAAPSAFRLIVEKVPFFVLSGISVYLTLSLKTFGAVLPVEPLSLGLRISNALVSYVSFIGKMVWPQNLAVHYPYPDMLPIWKTASAGSFLILVSLLTLFAVKRRPYLVVGWLWFLGTLVPVSGIVQPPGLWPAMADRWAYVPFIGLFIIAAWGASDLTARWKHREKGLFMTAVAALLILSATAWLQTRYWANSITLFKHAVQVTSNNSAMHHDLGIALANKGRITEAMKHFYAALRINPRLAEPHLSLGIALTNQGNIPEATGHLSESLRIAPDYAEAHNAMGFALAEQGNTVEAIRHYQKALKLDPELAEAHNGLGVVRAKQNRMDEAIKHFSEALRIDPHHKHAQINLKNALKFRKQEKDRIEN
jgi:tetratricopeptide (TPR) repeat protein